MAFLKKHTNKLAFFALLLIFCGQYLANGVNVATDTIRFEAFSPLVYPLYSIALWFFRSLFGVKVGYFLLGLFQNLLLVMSICSLCNYVKKVFRLELLTYIVLLLVSSLVFFLQKWFTRAGIISSNTLFSEALSIPLYLFFFRYTLQSILERSKKAFLFGCLFATGLILTRGQLYWVILIVFITRLYLADQKAWKTLLSALLICAVIAGCVEGSRVIQTLSVSDEQEKAPANMYVLTTAVYCSEQQDAALFPEGSGERLLLEQVRPWMDDPAHQAAFSYETGDLTRRHKMFENTYDDLKVIINTHYTDLTAQGYTISMGHITAKLIFANLGAFLLHCGQNALTGMIRTVAILKPGINLMVGVFFAYLMICLLLSRKNEHLQNERRLTCLGLLCAALNALIMAPGVFALSRYMIYNMPIMYLAAILFLRGLILQWCKNKKVSA